MKSSLKRLWIWVSALQVKVVDWLDGFGRDKKKLRRKLVIQLAGLDFPWCLGAFFRAAPSVSHRNDTIRHKKWLQMKYNNKILVLSCGLLASKTAPSGSASFDDLMFSLIGFACVCVLLCVQVSHVWLRTVPCRCQKTLSCRCCPQRSSRTNIDATSSETTLRCVCVCVGSVWPASVNDLQLWPLRQQRHVGEVWERRRVSFHEWIFDSPSHFSAVSQFSTLIFTARHVTPWWWRRLRQWSDRDTIHV